MKILIINPNSDPKMTEQIQKTAQDFADGAYEAVCESTPGAPKFIETYEDQITAAPGMIQLLKEHKDADAFIVACHCDPHLDVLKEMTAKPVVGIGEASMKLASMLGHKFSIIQTIQHSIHLKEALVQKYHLSHSLASIKAPSNQESIEKERKKGKEKEEEKEKEREKYLQAAQSAVTDDMAEVIVLGCAGMTGLDKYLQEKLQVPVLDGVICALIVAAGLVRYGISISKIRRYNPHL